MIAGVPLRPMGRAEWPLRPLTVMVLGGTKRQRPLHLEVGETPWVADERAQEVRGVGCAGRRGRAVSGHGRRGSRRGRGLVGLSSPGSGRAQALGRGSRWAAAWASGRLMRTRKRKMGSESRLGWLWLGLENKGREEKRKSKLFSFFGF